MQGTKMGRVKQVFHLALRGGRGGTSHKWRLSGWGGYGGRVKERMCSGSSRVIYQLAVLHPPALQLAPRGSVPLSPPHGCTSALPPTASVILPSHPPRRTLHCDKAPIKVTTPVVVRRVGGGGGLRGGGELRSGGGLRSGEGGLGDGRGGLGVGGCSGCA